MGLDMNLYRKNFNQYENIGYWRKANHIHEWFVNNVQGGVDNCEEYSVTSENLEELLRVCREVLLSTELEDGVVKNGSELIGGVWVPIYEEGKIVVNTEVAERLLPTKSGFFFGSIEYDQWYVEDIVNTIKICQEALKDPREIYYSSSW